jgi:membrane-bound lytic murein transglycosylase B
MQMKIITQKVRYLSAVMSVVGSLLLVMLAAGAMAQDPKTFFDELQKRLIADGFAPQRITQIYQSDQVFFESRGVSAYFLHNEATLNYKKMTKPNWINEARAYMKENRQALDQAEVKYGVDPDIITAIILVETKFGRYLGNRSIINILSTMASLTQPEPREYLWGQLPVEKRYERNKYDQKADQKADWAYNELKAFLTYTEQHGIDAITVVGSYAGAVGIAQFMPSNIIAYGQDGNGDGRIDLFDDADAIFSIASYLKHYGWQPGIDRQKAYKVVFNYNHSSYYVDTILEIADLLKG